MKRNFILAFMLLVTASASAVEVEIDGLWYDVVWNTKEAKVISPENGKYSGNIVIPETVEYNKVSCSVTSIEANAFKDCKDLTSVTIPNSVTSIGGSAFSNCKGLTSVTIPNSVMSIGQQAFYLCSGLTSVTIGNSVTSIGITAFSGCSGLTSVTIPNSVTSIGAYAFSGCSGLTSVTIGNSVTRIGNWAFSSCSGLTSVTIPNSVTSIGDWAFYYCSGLTTITIGSGVENIGSQAFSSCPKLTDVYCCAEKVPGMKDSSGNPCTDAFEDSNIENAKLHVPTSSIDAYKAVKPWKKFKSIIGLEMPKCATPTISFANGELEFSCETEDVEFVSEVTVGDAKKSYGSKVSLTCTYVVSVYATKAGYEDSDVATTEIKLSAGGGTGMKGDVNEDNIVDVADIATIISIMAAQARQQMMEMGE